MKKILFMVLLACMFISCSSDGSREIQIDEISFSPRNDFIQPNDIEKVSSIFEVVPGKYQLSWNVVQEVPQAQNYNVSLKLKLRLKKTVKFTDEFIEKTRDTDYWFDTFEFYLLDADGKEDTDAGTFSPGKNGCTNGGELFDKDEYMDFINFLQSEPGTEKEFVFDAFGMKTSIDGVNCIETCKNAKSIICKIDKSDKDFEREIGTIE